MTNLTEAEKAHGWRATTSSFYWNEGMVAVPKQSVRHIKVCVSDDGFADSLHMNTAELDDLILALLQAKGIHRRMVAEMTNTTHEGV